MQHHFKKILFLFLLLTFVGSFTSAHADRLSELRRQIEDKGDAIGELEEEIAQYQRELTEIGKEKSTLKTEIEALDLSRKKVETDIAVTERQIDSTVLTIEGLSIEIEDKEEHITLNTDAIGDIIRRINEADSQTLVEAVLGYENLSEFWNDTDALMQFQSTLSSDLRELAELKAQLEAKREELVRKRSDLSGLRNNLSGQREVIVSNVEEKDQLLDVTENKEANYQALLQEKIRQREKFEQELRAIEEALRVEIDPSSIPTSGSSILAWPLDNIIITQYFGNTRFATANPQIYNGGGHNGMDFGAPRGTQVKAALSGTVEGTGNTDAVPGCFSYGKWILVKHKNGLSTLYTHLDVISVTKGQSVGTSETIGFSGNTGFSTGPHLHFTVFASQGVKIQQFTSSINCKNAVIPIAPRNAYLNPLSYLPKS